MNDVTNIINEFNTLLTKQHFLSDDVVVKYLDDLCESLNLDQIFVVTNSIEPNNYLYSYVSSKGELAVTMHKNLFVVPNESLKEMAKLFSNQEPQVVTDKISLSTRGLAIGNLAYGLVDYNHVYAFVSFKAKEEHEWTIHEKEIIVSVTNSLMPLIDHIQNNDASIYSHMLANTNVEVFYYYPKLNIVVVPETTRVKTSISNFYYKNANETFIREFVLNKDVERMQEFLTQNLNETKTTSFHGAISKTREYVICSIPSRISNGDVEETLLCFQEIKDKNHKASYEIERFREIYSRNNLLELSVNLKTEDIKYYKVADEIKSVYRPELNFSELIKYFSDNVIDPTNKRFFDRIMNTQTLITKLNDANGYLSFSCYYHIDGKKVALETNIIASNRSIYNFSKEVLISVRNVTNVESNNYDKYTGLYNLEYFTNALQDIIKKGNNNISLAAFQAKDFKNIEYVKGKEEALKTILDFAKILKGEFKDTMSARIEKDNFICYGYTDTIVEKSQAVIDKVNELFNDFKVDVKCGIYNTNEFDLANKAIDKACISCDKALTQPDSIVIYNDKLKQDIIRNNYIIDHIDEAIEKNYIKVFYQPVIDSKNKNIVGLEALSRWNDPLYGFLSPGDFIPVLEENNLIYKLDLYVLEEICKNLRYQLDRGYNVCPISFNLSRTDFLKTEPFDKTIELCKKYDIGHNLLNVEITETVTMIDKKLIQNIVKKYQDNGFEVWMDDFGSGYSSLNVLKDFDFDEIKIDMAFLKKFNDKSKLIVKSIINMCKDLGVRTLCEGVETKEHVDFLSENGCDRIQGYYYSKPLPYEEVIASLAERKIFIL